MNTEKKKYIQGDVLIVDDNLESCEIIQDYCKKMGYFRNVLFAHDGSLASIKLRNQKFALILLNLNIPKKSGLDILREMDDDKSLNLKSNIVVLSEAFERIMVEEIIEAGVRAFLQTPFSETSLQEKVVKTLGIK